MRNIEIKAQVRHPDDLLSKIKKLSDTECVVIKQHDTFFCATQGRLKLREFENGSSELIYYIRPNTAGPKLCYYEKTSMDKDTTQQLKNILCQANGIIGNVNKIRQLYMVGQTRVHIDEVDGLGHFMELEVVLKENQDNEEGQKIANDLMSVLNINQDDLISEAYIDMLNKTD